MITTEDPGALRILISPEEFVHFDHGKGSMEIHRFRNPLFSDNGEEGTKELEEQLKKIPEAPEGRVHVYFSSARYAFFPEKLYEEGLGTELFNRLFSVELDEKEIRREHSRVSDDHILYWFPEKLKVQLGSWFPGFVPHPFITVLQEQLFRFRDGERKALVLAHLRAEEVDIGILQGKEQLLFNSYPCQNKEDLVYFLLQACERTLEGEEPVQLHVMGCRPKKKKEEELIGTYFSEPRLHLDRERGYWRSPIQALVHS